MLGSEQQMRSIPPRVLEILCCPETGERLEYSEDGQSLVSRDGHRYTVSDGVPILLSHYWTPFDFVESHNFEASGFLPRLFRKLGRLLPPLDANTGSTKAFEVFFNAAPEGGRCLVIGAGDNQGVNDSLRARFSNVIVTDIVKGPGTDVVCDGHALPFDDDVFDAVIIVAVLEHVLSPERVVGQVTRVLKAGGVIYSDTAFMQQVHMGRFDFSRFTDLGHRWLFRCYDELLRSNAGGPGAGLTWAITYFFLSFCGRRRLLRLIMRALMRILFFWIHYFDYLLRHLPASRDAASGVIFVGLNRKMPILNPRDLVTLYRGGY